MDDESFRAIQNLSMTWGADSSFVTLVRAVVKWCSTAAESAELRKLMEEGLTAFEAAKAAAARFEEKGPGMAAAAHAKGLIIPSSQISLYDLTKLVDVYETQGDSAVVSAIETEYEKIFGAPEFLDSLGKSWMASNLLAPRWPILNDALKAHTHRLFGASIPVLIAQAEGIIVDLRGHTGPASMEKIRDLLQEAADSDEFTGRLVTDFFRNVLHTRFVHGTIAGPLSRHAILHGADLNYPSERNSRTAILLIDVLQGYEVETLTSPPPRSAST